MLNVKIAKYCKERGYTKDQFLIFKVTIYKLLELVYRNIKYTKGVYIEIDFIPGGITEDIEGLIIVGLKEKGIEYNNDYSKYRK